MATPRDLSPRGYTSCGLRPGSQQDAWCPGRGLRGGELKASLPLPSAMRTSRLPLHREAMSALGRARTEPISVGTSDREVMGTRGRTVYMVYRNCVCSSRQKGFYL